MIFGDCNLRRSTRSRECGLTLCEIESRLYKANQFLDENEIYQSIDHVLKSLELSFQQQQKNCDKRL